jgi:hypothetical protein
MIREGPIVRLTKLREHEGSTYETIRHRTVFRRYTVEDEGVVQLNSEKNKSCTWAETSRLLFAESK